MIKDLANLESPAEFSLVLTGPRCELQRYTALDCRGCHAVGMPRSSGRVGLRQVFANTPLYSFFDFDSRRFHLRVSVSDTFQ